MSGSGSVTKTGDGMLTLSDANTFTGGTSVSDGTLTLTYINGTKGTLATGSTVTVDGETSVLAGHGDVLGYSSGSVGTINLQNGGTLYNDSTDAHVTVGAAVNMNHGFITVDENAAGTKYGNFVFDNAINVTGGEDNEISAKKIILRQYSGTSDEEVGGKITVASGAKLTISSQIAAHTSPTVVPLVKLGAGELVLTTENTYSKGTTVSKGTLTLAGAGTTGAGTVAIAADGTLNYYVTAEEDPKQVNVNNANAISGTGAVTKTGSGTLKINAAQNAVDVESFVVSSGRLDMKEYFKGDLEINNGATFSPGNSIGMLYQTGDFTLDEGATLWLEVGKGDTILTDVLNVTGDTIFEDGSIIKIALDSSYDNAFEDGEQVDIQLPTGIKGGDGNDLDMDNLVFQSSMFNLVGYDAGTGYLSVVYSAPTAGVPEPSTWTLLILGAAGLLYCRKRKN